MCLNALRCACVDLARWLCVANYIILTFYVVFASGLHILSWSSAELVARLRSENETLRKSVDSNTVERIGELEGELDDMTRLRHSFEAVRDYAPTTTSCVQYNVTWCCHCSDSEKLQMRQQR